MTKETGACRLCGRVVDRAALTQHWLHSFICARCSEGLKRLSAKLFPTTGGDSVGNHRH
ncbi:hypothetical protein NOVA_69 [Mycobacterium phage Nova]|uniref:Uncharacterized protein n=2 Tax=Plotvirus plot TaxID=2170099 RepID=B5U3U7_9CAUD|nr:gp71 [Mycobacterium phage Gumball]ACI06443.1 hypothetical protein GUMBALL_69 [Mycobacterium phage Gumball]AER49822.1 hypothetical protein NOVA_69 [Mycobacterium phage Nova]